MVREFEERIKQQLDDNLVRLLYANSQQSREHFENSPRLGLVDLSPLNFSRPELLALLSDEWFQRTGYVSPFSNLSMFKPNN